MILIWFWALINVKINIGPLKCYCIFCVCVFLSLYIISFWEGGDSGFMHMASFKMKMCSIVCCLLPLFTSMIARILGCSLLLISHTNFAMQIH